MIQTTTAQTVAQIRQEAAPILTDWIERAQTYGLYYVDHGTLQVHRVGKRVVAWARRSAPSTQVIGNWIFAAGECSARLGNHSDMDSARSRVLMQMTDRQRQSVQTETVKA